MSSAWENFFAATVVLASAGPIKHRLTEAFREHLADLEEDELPREIRDEFTSLSTTLSSVRPMRGENAVQATVRKMSDSEAGDCAVRIVGMLGVLARLQAAQRAPKLRAVGED
ncbi:hypothetical protein [Steroidobacter sp.]|uniref:hypothetical protein n=1 Tax=Steroidobacter sp. TaxID=1978227 RepID=UPI001A4ACBC7|nr:hypothetical protein [Steroidobacter sp.]MBL8266738.1 hypothetical protein [Steroidobacter sp.]